MRGKADYICEVKNKTRWVIEAKSPSESITDIDAIEQTWSYANHPEVRSVYFCLCNGLNFFIFLTHKGANASAIFECAYEEMEDKLNTIKNILAPQAILRDYPDYKPDYGEPLALSLRSFARLTNGQITYQTNSLNIKPFQGLVMTITDGSVERDETGNIDAYVKTQVSFQQLQDLNEKLGLHEFSLETADRNISENPETPTQFIGKNEVVLPSGMKVLDLLTWQEVALQMNLSVTTETLAVGFLENKIFQGTFMARLLYQEIQVSIQFDGTFTAHIN